MKAADIRPYIGEKVEIILRNGWRYTNSDFEELLDDNQTIKIIDRFGHPILIARDQISVISMGTQIK